MRRESSARLISYIALAGALALAACTTSGGGGAAVRTNASTPLPAAERLDSGLMMVPVARDGRGCVQYRLESERRPRLDALFYRTRAGDFSTIEAEAACT